jgi:zinc D-Ala-D-Ala carboxypeptidase
VRYKYFSEQELSCKCGCARNKMDPAFMEKLVAIREKLGFPFPVGSAYRCPSHNDAVSSTGVGGPHTWGRAIDLHVGSRARFLILEEAKRHGMTRFGIARWGIHLDDLTAAEGFDENVIFTY